MGGRVFHSHSNHSHADHVGSLGEVYDRRIRLVSSPKTPVMAGPAFTVKGRAGDNLALHAALNLCREGNVIVGDADGVICIPRQDAPAILEAAKKFRENDRKKQAASKDGSVDRSWVEWSLEAKGFEIIDGVCRS